MLMESAASLYAEAEKNYTTSNPQSQQCHARACQSLPGGNTRSALFYKPYPLSISAAKGARLYDVDGHEYIDLLGEFTAGVYGHSDPVIARSLVEAISRGLGFGAHHEDEAALAKLIKDRFPSIDLVRFTNSGTEATMMALAVAKVYTGKKKIIVFRGAYHGSTFSFLTGKSDAVNSPHEYLLATYNDLNSVQCLLSANVAAIILEPMTGSGGGIVAERGFLEGLRHLATKHGTVLIYDEVMTSRMYRGGGIQSQLPEEVRPDMTTLGKYIGGGASFGAFGGKCEIMELLDPTKAGALAHAGTFNNNVLSMAAGRAGLEQVFTPDAADRLHKKGDRLRQRLRWISQGTILRVAGLGSILVFHFIDKTQDELKSPADLVGRSNVLGDLFHLYLLAQGFHIARRGFLALSLAISDEDLDRFVEVVQGFIRQHSDLLWSSNKAVEKL